MRRIVRAGCVLSLGLTGCATVPPVDNPGLVRPLPEAVENPLLLSPGLPTPDGYSLVYDRAIDALDDYFDIKPGSRYSGQIETYPKTAPGLEQLWKPGSPDARERLLAMFQSIRHYAIVKIAAGERGGFRVYVEVYKELEDLGRPAQAVAGGAAFREAPTVDRRIEVVSAVALSNGWIPQGRDPAFEEAILRKIRKSCR